MINQIQVIHSFTLKPYFKVSTKYSIYGNLVSKRSKTDIGISECRHAAQVFIL